MRPVTRISFLLLFVVLLLLAFTVSVKRKAAAQNTTPDAPSVVLSCTAAPPGMVAWWAGDGNALDSRSRNNGTLQNGATFAAGKVGQAFSLDGTNDDVMIPASANLNVGAGSGMTIELWISPANLNERSMVEWNNGSIGAHFAVSVVSQGETPGNLYANLIDTGGSSHVLQSSGGFITANTLQHVALTYDKTTGLATIYLNGAAIAGPTNIGGGSLIYRRAMTFILGAGQPVLVQVSMPA